MNTGINERQVRDLAYTIWESEGRPIGQAERHWNMALSLVEADGEQYLTGQNLSGESFLGDRVNSGDEAILADDREYAQMAEDIESNSQAAQTTQNGNFDQNGERRQSFQSSSKGDKKKPGKKSSNNILV